MVHSSPGGMSAADYYLYDRYDELIARNRYDLAEAENRFDGIGSTAKSIPQQCREVVKLFPGLKICLAHFGGYTLWRKVGSFEKADEELRKREDAGDKKHPDTIDLYRDWIKTTAGLIQEYDNVYTDISYFKNSSTLRRNETDSETTVEEEAEGNEDIAENLVYLLKSYSGLKDRLMVGTDWLMIELERENGIGDYMHRMFETLKIVSKEVGYDAWHQFAVVNPLRFMGLIEEKKGSDGPFEVKVELLERYGKRLLRKMEEKGWKNRFKIKISKDKVEKKICEQIEKLKEVTIASSSSIITNGKLLILNE